MREDEMLGGITDSMDMSLSKLLQLVMDRQVLGASMRSPACGKGHEVKGLDRQRRVGP